MRNSSDLYLTTSGLRNWLFSMLATLLYACSSPAPAPAPASTPAPKPVPLSEAVPALKEEAGGRYLLTVTISNDLAPDYQPGALFVRI